MCFIIPQNIHRSILKNGNKNQRNFATQNLRHMHQFAHQRLDSFRNLLTFRGKTSEVVEQNPCQVKGKPSRFVHDAEHKSSLPGKLVRSEAEKAHKDVAVNQAYDGSGLTFDFFSKLFGRNSIDNNGMKLISTVHFGRNYANAFWNGQQMTYGDGDGEIFNPFVGVLDVIGHELTHGVTEHTAGLVYRDQPGALNEHMSDVFGSLVKQYSRKQKAQDADWIIGEGLFTPQVNGRGIRDMLHPGTAYDDPIIGKDRQPDHMSGYKKIPDDNGGVHIYSGIPNRAFANAAIAVGGYAWEKMGKVWYYTLTHELSHNSQFQDCADATFRVAGMYFGNNSVEQKAVLEGWKLVGLTPKGK